MYRKTLSRGNLSGIVIALIVLAIGVVLTVEGFFLLGVPIAILALFMGGKRVKVWKCAKCSYFFERA